MNKTKLNTNKAEVYIFDNFLSDEECDHIIEVIDKLAVPSSVIASGKSLSKPIKSKYRTSNTASIRYQKYPEFKSIDRRISRAIGIPLEVGEVIQGQRYEVGQEFKNHTDYFGSSKVKASKGPISKWGDRTWTFMIYLNDDCEGGHTDFPKLKHKFIPKKGQGVAWMGTDPKGRNNPYTLHAGRPVTKGKKYIITKWFREHPTNVYPISSYFKSKFSHMLNKPEPTNGVVKFSKHEDIPKFTKQGFELRDLPPDVWELIQATYKKLLPKIKPEKFKGQMGIIHNKDKTESPVDIINLGFDKRAKEKIHAMLLPVLKEWSGADISPVMMYGIRSYKDGAILTSHRDRVKTHHISCIVIVDEDSDEPWALDIQSHDGKWHEVVAKPGQVILYESATCKHGRTKPFKGNWFRNMFIHYKLNNYEYVGNQK